MRPQKLIPVLLLGLINHSSAISEERKRAGDEIISSLKGELKELAGNEDDDDRSDAVKQYLRQIQSALAQENGEYIIQSLESNDNYAPSEKVQQAAAKLKQAVKNEQIQRSRDTAAELQRLITEARGKVIAAKNPEDLDDLIESLSREKFNNSDDGEDKDPATTATIRSLFTSLNYAKQFCTLWQDYLQAKKSGNSGRAATTLQSLSQQENPLIPRSQIIARLDQERATPEDFEGILEGVKSLDQMSAALQQLSAIQQKSRSSDSYGYGFNEPTQTLSRLEKCYRDFNAGLPVNLEVFSSTNDSPGQNAKIDFPRLRADLLILVLPRYLAIQDAAKANEKEPVDAYLGRLLSDAKAKGNVTACQRIRDLQQTLGRSNRYSTDDAGALRDYASGQNQLAAHQYMLAVISLQSSLKSGSDLLPVDKIGGQLEAIKSEHPEEFKQGMTEFLTQRAAPDYDYSRMPYRGNMDPRMRGMSAGGPPPGGMPIAPGTPVVLPVPAKDAEPGKPAVPAPPAPPVDGKPTAPGKPPGE
jgi:hypothetical protein